MKKLLLWIGILTGFTHLLYADEGMWLLPLIEELNMAEMQEIGLELTAEQIYSVNNSSLKDAIVIFGAGCTGEMISPNGLLLTNHHCGFGEIQSHSTVENNILQDGFWAASYKEELPNPGLKATFLVRMEEVTKEVLQDVEDEMSEENRQAIIEEASRRIENQAENGNHYSAKVKPFFAGNRYYLLVYEIFKDVRLVGTPPLSVGKFGADTDNWMWPRHTGDFSLFRIYADKDGKPAEYSEANVPYKPKHHLPISIKGFEKGDFAMVLGNPGSTDRYMTSFGVAEVQEIIHPNRIKIRGLRQELIMEDMMNDPAVKIQYATKYSRSSNYWKFSIGQSKGLKELGIYDKKKELEDNFTQWLNKDTKRKEKYGNALKLIEEGTSERAKYLHARQYIREVFNYSTEIFDFASEFEILESVLQSNALDNIQPTVDRLTEKTDNFYKNYNVPTDMKITKAMLKLFYKNVPKEFHPDFYTQISAKLSDENYEKHIDKYVDKLYQKSIFADKEKVYAFLNNPSLNVLVNDPAFLAGKSITETYRKVIIASSEPDEKINRGKRLFMAGLMEMQKDKKFYPDANFTMRLTYGTVGDYKPRDAVLYDFQTTLKGVMEKEDPDNFEFIVEPELKSLYQKKDYGRYGEEGKLFVNFTTNNDITGGNSGSPVLNGKGELIGLAFDGNWEAMSGDIVFEDELQKCINVDARYLLFIIDKLAGAQNIIEELTIIE